MSTPTVSTPPEQRAHWKATCDGCGSVTAAASESPGPMGRQKAERFVSDRIPGKTRTVKRVAPGDPEYPVHLSMCTCKPEAVES